MRMPRAAERVLSASVALLVTACSSTPPPVASDASAPPTQPTHASTVGVESAPAPAPAPAGYATPVLDAPTLAREIRAVCESAVSEHRPILLEFSAPWCADCVALEQLKRAPALSEELSHWRLLPINVGSGDEHPQLMRAFHVDAIAKLVVLVPKNCAAPIGTWQRGPARTLDGLRHQGESADAWLANWLASARGQLGSR